MQETVLTHRRERTEFGGLRALVIDECPAQRAEICRRLRNELGHEARVWEAEDAADALSILAQRPIDVAFVDYPWSARDGVDLLGEIMSTSDDTVVVLLTGHGHPIVPAEALRRGADAYLSRSELAEESLARLLGRLIASRRLRQDQSQRGLDLRALAEHLAHVEQCLDQSGRRARRLTAALHHGAPGSTARIAAQRRHRGD